MGAYFTAIAPYYLLAHVFLGGNLAPWLLGFQFMDIPTLAPKLPKYLEYYVHGLVNDRLYAYYCFFIVNYYDSITEVNHMVNHPHFSGNGMVFIN